ncbi:hypothetical protein EBR57_03360, partial [bacterium]|nr:hypothetical protein [bacterium]
MSMMNNDSRGGFNTAHFAKAFEVAARNNALAGKGDTLTTQHLENLTAAITNVFQDKAQGVNVLVGLVRGSEVMESQTPVAKATVLNMLQMTPEIAAGVISDHSKPGGMAAALNNLCKTLVDEGESPSRAYAVVGELSPRMPGGDPQFWEKMFAASDVGDPDGNALIVRDGPNLNVPALTQLFQRCGPSVRDGLVAYLDRQYPGGPTDLAMDGGPSWGVLLYDRLNGMTAGVDVRSLRPDGSLDSTTQLLLASENPKLDSDALLPAITHIAADPDLSSTVLPALLASGPSFITMSRLAAANPELCAQLAERLENGDVTGPAAKLVRSLPGVKTQMLQRMDDIISESMGVINGPKGPLDLSGSISSETELNMRMDQVGIPALAPDRTVHPDRERITQQWIDAINATPAIAMTMAEMRPELIRHLNHPNLEQFMDAHFSDIEHLRDRVQSNPNFRAVAVEALRTQDSRARIAVRAITDPVIARGIVNESVLPGGRNVAEILRQTMLDPQFLQGAHRGTVMTDILTDLMQLPDPMAQRNVSQELAVIASGRTSLGDSVPKEWQIVAGNAMVAAGQGDTLSGMALLGTIKSNGNVPPLSSNMAGNLIDMADSDRLLTDFSTYFPDLAASMARQWPVAAIPLPDALRPDNRLVGDRPVGEADPGFAAMLATGAVPDQMRVDLMFARMAGNPAVIGQTVADVHAAVTGAMANPSLGDILATPVFQVLSHTPKGAQSIWDRLTTVAGQLDVSGSSDLADRSLYLIKETRTQLVAKFEANPGDDLVTRARQMKTLWELSSSTSGGTPERERLVASFLQSVHDLESSKPKTLMGRASDALWGKEKSTQYSAEQLMTALSQVAGDDIGSDMLATVVKTFMSKSDEQSASIVAGLATTPALTSVVLSTVEALHPEGPTPGTRLHHVVSEYVREQIGYPDDMASGKLVTRANDKDDAKVITKSLKNLTPKILAARVFHGDKLFTDQYSDELTRFLVGGLASADSKGVARELFADMVRMIPAGAERRDGKTLAPWMGRVLDSTMEKSFSVLGNSTGLAPSTLTATLNQMEQDGLVVRVTPAHDPDKKIRQEPHYRLAGDVIQGHGRPFSAEVDAVVGALSAGVSEHDELIKALVKPSTTDPAENDKTRQILLGLLNIETLGVVNALGKNATKLAYWMGSKMGVSDARPNLTPPAWTASREALENSIKRALPSEAAALTRDLSELPMYKWCPDMKDGFQGGPAGILKSVGIGTAGLIMGGGTVYGGVGGLLGLMFGAGRSLVRAGMEAAGMEVAPDKPFELNLDPGTDILLEKIEADGISDDVLEHAAAPITSIHSFFGGSKTPLALIESALTHERPDLSNRQQAALGMMVAYGLAEGGKAARERVEEDLRTDAKVTPMGIQLDRLDRADVRMRELMQSDPGTRQGKGLDAARVVNALASEGFSLTDILVTARSIEVEGKDKQGEASRIHSELLGLGSDILAEAAMTGAEVRARRVGVDVAVVKQELV